MSRHFHQLRVAAAITALFQIMSLTGYLFVAAQVGETRAADITFQLRIRATAADRTQNHYRWRNDDGDQATATFGANEDTATTTVALGDTKRLRIEVANLGGASTSDQYVLQYSAGADCTSGSWSKVEDAASCGGMFCLYNSQLTNGALTTNVANGLADGNTAFVAGVQVESTATTSHISLDTTDFTEMEFAVQATGTVSYSTSYYFRLATVSGDTASAIDTYSVCPALTTAAAPSASTPAPTPTPAATQPGGGGAAGPPTHLPPQQRPDPYVAGEDTVAPYIYVTQIDNASVLEGQTATIYARSPGLVGKTNLREAVVFIEISDLPGVLYTVHADGYGVWEFTAPMPLPLGWHTLYLTALSPIASGLRANGTFQFEIIPIPPVGPLQPPIVPPVTPPPPAIPVQPPTEVPLPPVHGLYDLNVEVEPTSKVIVPGQGLEVITKITPLAPPAGEEKLPLTYRIIDENGREVFSKKEDVAVSPSLEFPQYITPKLNLPPGSYWVTVDLQRGSTTYRAIDQFRVATATVPFLAGLTVPIGAVGDLMLRLSFILALFLFVFLGLLVVEYHQCRQAPQVSEDNLLVDGEIQPHRKRKTKK